MNKFLLGTGRFSWNAEERRLDRYGFVRLFDKDSDDGVPLNGTELEGQKGKLIAEVIEVQESPHCGDLARGITPTTPDLGEEIELGEGEFVFEHHGQIHEKSEYEKEDEEFMDGIIGQLFAAFAKAGAKVEVETEEELPGIVVKKDNQGLEMPVRQNKPEIYDMVGLKPEDGRKTDWLNPHKLYRCHHQIVKLYFVQD